MTKNNLHKIPYIIIGGLVFVYVFIRVFYVPVTTDEVWTLFGFVRTSIWDIITIKNPSTNNHIFNTLLTKLTTCFSERLFFLRLPNLLALILYIYGAYKIAWYCMSNKFLGYGLFIMLLSDYYMIEFFGVCRGYGLSLGLFTLSIAYLFKIANSLYIQNKDVHITLFCAAAAFYANIAVLHIMVAIILILTIILYKRHSKPILQRLKLPIVYSMVIGILGGLKLIKQYQLGEIFYGGQENFIDDTLASLMSDYTEKQFFLAHPTWTMNIFVFLIIMAITLPPFFIKKFKNFNWVFIAWSTLLFNIVMINIQFYLLDVPLPIGRIALFLYPLIIISLYGISELFYKNVKLVIFTLNILVCIFGTYRFVSNMSTDYMGTWWFDMYSDEVLDYVIHDYKGDSQPKIFTYWPADNGINYYAQVYHKDEVIETPCCLGFEQINHADSIDKYDYLYLEVYHDVSQYPQLKRVKEYHPGNAFILYKNTSPNY